MDNTKPEIEWRVFESDSEITDESVTVSEEGIVTAAKDCSDKDIVVKAISTEKGNAEGSYELKIKAVDFDGKKYDALSLIAEENYVRESEPLALTVSATKEGEPVELEDGDIKWIAYDENDIHPIDNKYISVVDNMLCVDKRVIPQNIVLHAENGDATVKASIPVRIKGDNITEADDVTEYDRLLITDSCEAVNESAQMNVGSWDGSHYYEFAQVANLKAVDAITEDIMISVDVKFLSDNAGFKLRDSGNTKEGGQIALQNGKIGNIGSGNKFTAISNGDNESWYHIDILTRCGSESSYGVVRIYKYDEEGNLVNPDDGTVGKAAEGKLDLRTMSGKPFHHLQVTAGTAIDNLCIVRAVPDEIQLTLSADTVFAGGSVKGSFKALHRGVEMISYPKEKIEWAVYDGDDKYPVEGDEFRVDFEGTVNIEATASEQTVYVRAFSTESEAYGSSALMVKGSDIFTVTGFGTNEDGNELVELKVQKDFFYEGPVVFIVAAYDENGMLVGTSCKSIKNNKLVIGENKVPVEFELPENFHELKAMVWTSLGD